MKNLWLLLCIILFWSFNAGAGFSQSLWELANENKNVLRISTLFTAGDVRNHLSTDEGIKKAIDWCKNTGITRVFLETYRGGYTAERGTLERAKTMFEAAGIEVSGCVTTTRIGKLSSSGGQLSCYTSKETQKGLKSIFEFTASIFDEFIIDDFFMTDCQCEDCQKARGRRSMAEYRCDLMNEVSREYIIKPAKAINPKVKIILKYPLWYDFFHWRGYEVLGETASYDMIWVGTETRDYDYYVSDSGDVQYKAYFIMRWLGGIGGVKTGGGWFDNLYTSPDTYAEQARQTVLADAREMMLMNYGENIRRPDNIEKLRREIPGLFELAKMVRNKPLKGVVATKPANSDPYDNFDATEPFSITKPDVYVYDFIGMLGLPLIPSTEIDTNADAAFFSVQALKDPMLSEKLMKMLSENKPVLITDGLAERIGNIGQYKNLTVLPVNGNTHSLLKLSREKLNAIRDRMLAPIGIKFDAPSKVGLYLIGDDILVIENFNVTSVNVAVDTKFSMEAQVKLILPQEGRVNPEFTGRQIKINRIPPRTLVAIKY
jgi:hypothetical protein